MKNINTIRRYLYLLGVVLTLSAGLLLVACSNDSEVGRREINLVMGTETFNDVSVIPTRGELPAGFTAYNDFYSSRTLPVHAKIQGFFTNVGTSAPQSSVFTFRDAAGSRLWSTHIDVEGNSDYLLYGFMPMEDAGAVTIAPYSSDYANGAVLTVSDLKATSSSDVCVIVGVKGKENSSYPISDVGLQLGKFDYNPLTHGDNLYILVDHIYSSLRLEFAVGTEYNDLRTIKIKKMTLEPNHGTSSVKTVDATITLETNNTGDNPLTGCTISNASTGDDSEPVVIFDNSEAPAVLTTTSAQNCFRGYFAPEKNRSFVLETTYDVYDKAATPTRVRQNQKARNVLTIDSGVTMARGQEYVFVLTVEPTYLYVLSDPDLDNPTFTLQ